LGRRRRGTGRNRTRPHDTDFNEDFSQFDDVVELIESLAEAPDPQVRGAQIQATAKAALDGAVHPMHPTVGTSLTTILGRAAAALLVLVLGVSGLAAEAMLPGPIQNAVARVAEAFGIHFPTDNADGAGGLASNNCKDDDSEPERDGRDTAHAGQCAADDMGVTDELEGSDDGSDDSDDNSGDDDGSEDINDGSEDINDSDDDVGSEDIDDGSEDIDDGSEDIDDGSEDIDDGSEDIDDGSEDIDDSSDDDSDDD
jgi:hypothetical protein